MDKRKIVNKITDILFFLLGNGDRQLNYLMKSICMSFEKKSGWFVTYRLRRKKISKTEVIPGFVKLTERCGIIIQGEIKTQDDFTYETVRQYREYYPTLPIIVSTWEDTAESIIDKLESAGAEVILSKKPTITGLGNVNYQRISTKAGCKRVKELNCDYVLKTRTDQRIYRPFFLEYFIALIEQYPAANFKKNGKRLVVGPSIVGATMFIPFMLSDFLYFGTVSDVETIFWGKESDVNMSYEERTLWTEKLKGTMSKKEFYALTAPELHLIRCYCDIVGKQKTELTVQSYWQSIKESLICLGWNDIGLYWPKYGLYNEAKIENTLDEPISFNSYTWDFGKWLLLYQDKLVYRDEYEKISLENK